MRQKSPYFSFKQFRVCHSRSAMKVGVDSVLLGAWVNLHGIRRSLDVGTGCGLLALMIAQRSSELVCDAIEIDHDAAAEASENIDASPWADRLKVKNISFDDFCGDPINHSRYDLLISNPPYFNSGIREPKSSRLKARHQSTLSASILLEKGKQLLTESGRIAMVIPSDQIETILISAEVNGFRLLRHTAIRGHVSAPVKRALLEFGFTDKSPELNELILEQSPGVPTSEHNALCADFYLKFG